MKRIVIQGLLAGVLSGTAGIVYLTIYQSALAVHFDTVIGLVPIVLSSIAGCLLMSCGYAVLIHFGKQQLLGWANITIAVLSFVSITGPLTVVLPMDIKSPELFPGLVIPMHFFPALAFFVIAPFFQPIKNNSRQTAASYH